MKKQALGVTFFAFAAVGMWLGCGGSSDSGVGSSSGDTPDGSGTGTATPPPPPPPNNPPPPPPPPAPPSTDGASDVTVDGTAVSMTYGSCASFTPCGGDPTGTWKYAAGGCIAEIDKSACPSATISNTNITVKGTVTFSGGTNVSRSAQISLSAKASIPASCTKGLPCSIIQAGLTQPPPTGLGMDTATCTTGASGSCDCDVGKTVTDVRSGTYTLTNGGHTIQTDDNRTYDFCVDTAAPAKFTYKDVTPNTPIQATFVMSH
jgi:hypothetical protein